MKYVYVVEILYYTEFEPVYTFTIKRVAYKLALKENAMQIFKLFDNT